MRQKLPISTVFFCSVWTTDKQWVNLQPNKVKKISCELILSSVFGPQITIFDSESEDQAAPDISILSATLKGIFYFSALLRILVTSTALTLNTHGLCLEDSLNQVSPPKKNRARRSYYIQLCRRAWHLCFTANPLQGCGGAESGSVIREIGFP